MPSNFERPSESPHASDEPRTQDSPKDGDQAQDGLNFICHECQALDWPNISTMAARGLLKGGGQMLRLFNMPNAVLQASPCKICRLFSAMKPASYDGVECRLKAVPAHMALLEPGASNTKKLVQCTLVGVEAPQSIGNDWQGKQCLAVMGPKRDNYDLSVQQVHPNSIDYTMLKGWLEYCVGNHQDCCKAASESVSHLKVIDVSTRTVIEAPRGCDYIALSYVWGQWVASSDDDDDLASAPPVIDDAIVVTEALGYEFLWVDKYCIPQNNAPEKHRMISQMDLIYANASVTIIAAAGQDAQTGLPGVSRFQRKSSQQVHIQGVDVIQLLPHGVDTLNQSHWAGRGWTFQEGYLSTRRLIFTDAQVLYLCNGAYLVESAKKPLAPGVLHHGRNPFLHLVPKATAGGHQTSIMGLADHIQDYSRRELSYDADSLNALLGVLNYYSRARKPVFNVWGVPLSTSEPVSLWLFWYHNALPKRRLEFPSWSWAGWGGPMEFVKSHYRPQAGWEREPTESERRPWQISIGDHNSSAVTLHEYADDLGNLSTSGENRPLQAYPRRLIISCPVTPIRFQSVVLSAEQRASSTAVHWRGFTRYYERTRNSFYRERQVFERTRNFAGDASYIAVLKVCEGVYVGAPPYLDREMTEEDGDILGLHMAHWNGMVSNRHIFLLVKQLGTGLYERVGLVICNLVDWNPTTDPEPVPVLYMDEVGRILDEVHIREKDVFVGVEKGETICLV